VRFFFAAKSSDAKLIWPVIHRPPESMTAVCHVRGVDQRFPKYVVRLAPKGAPSDEAISAALAAFDPTQVHTRWTAAMERRSVEPAGAITLAARCWRMCASGPTGEVSWVPASAGMTPVETLSRPTNVIPAEAGLARPSSDQPAAEAAESWILGTSPRMTVDRARVTNAIQAQAVNAPRSRARCEPSHAVETRGRSIIRQVWPAGSGIGEVLVGG
jgi:hypothetical protein